MESLSVGIALSLHVGFNDDYNPIHPYVKYDNEGVIAGAYYNSINQISMYAGKRFEFNDYGLEAAIATGYSKSNPLSLTPHIRATYKNYFFIPDFAGSDTGIVIGTELEF